MSSKRRRFRTDYDKNIDIRKITPDMIEEAVRRARVRDNPPCADWPRKFGSTTVYKLVANIINSVNTP